VTDRRYALTRVRAGSYLLPSNDMEVLWHIYSFEDGRSHGLDVPDRTYWACACYRGSYRAAVDAVARDLEDYGYVTRDDWHETDSYLRTRADAIRAALA
jgi:hypothetical protein